MSLAKTIEEIKNVKPFAIEDLDDPKLPRETLAGRRGRKMQAIESLRRLRREYKLDLLKSAAFIIVTGSNAKAFSDLATEKYGCFAASATEFYDDLAKRIPASLYQGKESMVNLFDIVGRHLEDKANELDLSSYNQLIFRQEHYVSVKTQEDLSRLIQTAVNSQMGAEIVGIQAISSILDSAIDRGHSKGTTPVVLSTDDEKLALDLETNLRRLGSRGVYLVVSGKGTKNLRAVPGVITVKDPSEQNVEQCLTNIGTLAKKGENNG